MSIPIRQLRTMSDDDLLASVVAVKEDQWLDRKSARTEPRTLGKTLVAMANAEGGLIVVGIHAGKVEGLAGRDVNALRQAGRNFAEPAVPHAFRLVACETGEGKRDQVAFLDVPTSEYVHRTNGGDVFLRVGDEDRLLRELEVRELEYDKGQSTFDGRPVAGAAVGDFAEERLAEYLAHLSVTTPALEVLEARGLVVRKERELLPTTAGTMLLARSPQRFFPEAWVRVIEHRGRTREVGSRANIVADRRFEGSLTEQIDSVREDLRARIPAAIRLGSDGRFAPTGIIPEYAWLEAIVNAVAHRSYSISGDHIRVELFDDRLEVESPGRLPGLVRVDNIRSTRFARNPRIARALADFGYGRELGEGVDRMFEEMERAGLPDPVFEQRPASVRVSLSADPVLARAVRALPARLDRLHQAVSRAGRLTTLEAMRVLGQSRPTVLRNLRLLEARGLIEHVGASKDPGGFWRIALPAGQSTNSKES